MSLFRIEFVGGPKDGFIKHTAILKNDVFLEDKSLEKEVNVPYGGHNEIVFSYHKYLLEKKDDGFVYKYQGII